MVLAVTDTTGLTLILFAVSACSCLLKVADRGVADAQYNIGVMYDFGQSVQEDDAEAMKWYRLAADQGLPEA